MTYSIIHSASPSSTSSALNVFAAPTTKTAVIESTDVAIGPLGNPDAADFDFSYQTSGKNYIDLRNTTLHVQCKVLKADGTSIDSGDKQKVMIVTNLLHCLWVVGQVALGNHTIDYGSNYQYLSYMENLLNSGEGSKRSTVHSHMWIHDDTRVIDKDAIRGTHKTYIDAHKALIANSKIVVLCGSLNSSFLLQDRYIPPGVLLKLRLTRSAPELCLVCTANDATIYKIQMLKCNLILRQVTVHPGIVTAHNSLHSTGHNMLYPYNKVEVQKLPYQLVNKVLD